MGYLHRSAEGSAKLVALQLIALRRKEISCVENRVPDKFERVPMHLVRAGFSNDVHHAAGIPAILGSVVGCLYAELLQRVRKREGHVGISEIVGVISPVELVADLVLAGPVHGHGNCRRKAERAAPVDRSGDGAGHKRSQPRSVSAVQGQIDHAPLVYYLV